MATRKQAQFTAPHSLLAVRPFGVRLFMNFNLFLAFNHAISTLLMVEEYEKNVHV